MRYPWEKLFNIKCLSPLWGVEDLVIHQEPRQMSWLWEERVCIRFSPIILVFNIVIMPYYIFCCLLDALLSYFQ
jgi:hypothetical protein